jgi:hypothetical protein
VAIWNILHIVIWYIFPRYGMLHPEKYGNPGLALLFTSESNHETFSVTDVTII